MRDIKNIVLGRRIAPFPLTREILSGARLKRRFRFARGGDGELFIPTRLARTVAVKASKRGDAESRGKIIHEAKILTNLHHENIIHCYGSWEEGDRAFLVLEYVDGGSLYRHFTVHPNFRFPLQASLKIIKEVASALAYMHSGGLVHADIKPENIIIGGTKGDPKVKLVDFAIARPSGQRVTGEGEERYFGTTGYISFDRMCGSPPDKKSDLYALGVVLKQMLLGANDPADDKGGVVQVRGLGRRIEETDLPEKVKTMLYKMTGCYPDGASIINRHSFQNAGELLSYINKKFPEIG